MSHRRVQGKIERHESFSPQAHGWEKKHAAQMREKTGNYIHCKLLKKLKLSLEKHKRDFRTFTPKVLIDLFLICSPVIQSRQSAIVL